MERPKIAPPFLVKLSDQGKITIPHTLRKRLGLKTGDWLVLEIVQIDRRGEQ